MGLRILGRGRTTTNAGMGPRIFISYRRDDSAGHAGRIHDRLNREFGGDLLFMDVDAIALARAAVWVATIFPSCGRCKLCLRGLGTEAVGG